MAKRLPKLCIHAGRRQWYVKIGGHQIYLGSVDTISEQEADARRLAVLQRSQSGQPIRVSRLTVSELISEYLDKVVDVRYRRADGTPTSEVNNHLQSFKPLHRVYGDILASDFGGAMLESLQKTMAGGDWKNDKERSSPVSRNWCCSQINKHISRVRQMFRWAAGRKLIPAEVVAEQALVPVLKPGQHGTHEPDDVPPVPLADVEKTLTKLSPVVADMVRVQLLTGARPGEICGLTPDQVDQTGELVQRATKGAFALPDGCWAIIPSQHKTAHRGKSRIIPVGPKAIEILRPYLDREPNKPCFSPQESKAKSIANRSKNKKKAKPKRKPKRQPGQCYSGSAYAGAVYRGSVKAGVPHWHPHQLRHTASTLLSREFGPEVARIVCGHSSLSATEIYVERDLKAAFNAIGKRG
jgi:integrase